MTRLLKDTSTQCFNPNVNINAFSEGNYNSNLNSYNLNASTIQRKFSYKFDIFI